MLEPKLSRPSQTHSDINNRLQGSPDHDDLKNPFNRSVLSTNDKMVAMQQYRASDSSIRGYNHNHQNYNLS